MQTQNKKMMPVAIILGVLIVVLLGGTIFLAVTGKVSTKSSTGKKNKAQTEKNEDTEENKSFSLEGASIPDGVTIAIPEAAGAIDTADPATYILPDSDKTVLSEADLEGLTAQELTYARNEIYARHGRVFASQELNDYFGKKEWYTADETFEDSSLSSIETQNADFISSYQNDNGLTYSPQ